MAVAEHSDNLELQEIDDTSHDDIDAWPAAQERDPLKKKDSQISDDGIYDDIDVMPDTTTTATGIEVEMGEEGHYEQLDVQQINDATYEDVATHLRKKLKSNKRRNRRVGVGVGLLFAVLALLNVAVPLHLYQTNMVEREQQMDKYNQLLDRINNLYKKDDLKSLCESDGFTFGDGLCYFISTVKTTWWNSRQWCKNRQSDLMVIKSKEKQDFVERVNKKTVWVGLSDKDEDGSFEWIDGTPLTTPKYWYPGRPIHRKEQQPNSTHRYCVEFLVKGLTPDTRGWNDIWCAFTDNPWICERVL